MIVDKFALIINNTNYIHRCSKDRNSQMMIMIKLILTQRREAKTIMDQNSIGRKDI